jgi:hypothetical protein
MLFEGKLTKIKRADGFEAVYRYRYSQRVIADCLNLHYATVNRFADQPDTRDETWPLGLASFLKECSCDRAAM